MKNKSNFLILSSFLGGLLFSYLFWAEKLALNLFIYSLYLITITYLNKDIAKSAKFKIYALAHILAALLVVVNNSDLTICSYYISLLLFVGFSHYQQIRTVFTAILASILQLITIPFNFIQSLTTVAIGRFNLRPVLKLIKYIFIPVFIVSLFTIFYSAANDIFAHYAESILINLSECFKTLFSFFFKDLTFERFVHLCVGTVLTGGLLFTFFDKHLENTEAKCNEKLIRTRRKTGQTTLWREIIQTFSGNLLNKKLALKTEYITSIISFIALNILLLTVNLIDIATLWFGYKPSGNFSADLHEGTNALILSIIMAMIVILYFFRGNLNFYSKSKTLKTLAYIWMVQNFILILSVFIRDGYYIEYYGLTHKRIGVLVFAMLCIIGLITVYIKVSRQKTFFYLAKINGQLWFALLLTFSTINWDIFIVKYNIDHANTVAIDPDYLLSLSDKTLPFLDKNRTRFIHPPAAQKIAPPSALVTPEVDLQKRLDQRITHFAERYKRTTWLSWNLPDWNSAAYFGINKL
ncbi:hypothetical protein ABIE26_003753 [Pedobacter africanus]|uniref:Uncharacterized protein n=1 Tax=Pedobacter africanus TaxID=151894 RepID=A0ACC6L0V5_9SPHI|nr:DUF4173 domain-containing protein [Pedobacter africanus]MDR6785055.1 hypothetical protein [Pedobacter africanus]